MSVNSGPKIIKDGLIFSFDTSDLKNSYKGKPGTNICTTISANTSGTGTGYYFNHSSEIVDIPTIGKRTVKKCVAYNDYPATSAVCCPAPFTYGTGLSVSGNTLYTYSLIYKSATAYTHPNFMYRYEYNGGTYVTEGGYYSDSRRVHLGNGWYWAWGQFTTNASTNIVNLYFFEYEYSTVNTFYVADVMLIAGDYLLPPNNFIPLGTTRSVTTSLYDTSGYNNTIDLTNSAYSSSGEITYDASNNYIPVYSISDSFWQNSWTVSVWCNFGSVSRAYDNAIVGHGYQATSKGLHLAERSSKVYFGLYGNDLSGNYTLSANTWYNITFTLNASSGLKTIYVNGTYDNSGGTTPYSGTGTNTEIGRYPWSTGYKFLGRISQITFYNRALTANDVAKLYYQKKTTYSL